MSRLSYILVRSPHLLGIERRAKWPTKCGDLTTSKSRAKRIKAPLTSTWNRFSHAAHRRRRGLNCPQKSSGQTAGCCGKNAARPRLRSCAATTSCGSLPSDPKIGGCAKHTSLLSEHRATSAQPAQPKREFQTAGGTLPVPSRPKSWDPLHCLGLPRLPSQIGQRPVHLRISAIGVMSIVSRHPIFSFGSLSVSCPNLIMRSVWRASRKRFLNRSLATRVLRIVPCPPLSGVHPL